MANWGAHVFEKIVMGEKVTRKWRAIREWAAAPKLMAGAVAASLQTGVDEDRWVTMSEIAVPLKKTNALPWLLQLFGVNTLTDVVDFIVR